MAVMVCALLAGGCGATNPVLPARFDSVTGDMIVTYRDALVFARPVPHLSAAARDYLYVGPVEVSRNGVQRYFLWIGVASTIDRELARERNPHLRTMRLELDGETLDLPLIAWDDQSDAPYRVPAPVHAALRTSIDFADLGRISSAGIGRITLYAGSGEPYEYTHWRGRWPQWEQIDADADIGFKVNLDEE